jgi:hypothetical protein
VEFTEPAFVRHGVCRDLSSRRAPRLRQWAEEGAWRAEAVSVCSVREFVLEMRGSMTTYDGQWRETTHENQDTQNSPIIDL